MSTGIHALDGLSVYDGLSRAASDELGEVLVGLPGIVVPADSDDDSDADSRPSSTSKSSSADDLYLTQQEWNNSDASDSDDGSSDYQSGPAEAGEPFSPHPLQKPAEVGTEEPKIFSPSSAAAVATTLSGAKGLHNARVPAEVGKPVPRLYFINVASRDSTTWTVTALCMGSSDTALDQKSMVVSKAPARILAKEIAARLGLSPKEAYLSWARDGGKQLIPVSATRRAMESNKAKDHLLLSAFPQA